MEMTYHHNTTERATESLEHYNQPDIHQTHTFLGVTYVLTIYQHARQHHTRLGYIDNNKIRLAKKSRAKQYGNCCLCLSFKRARVT